MLSGKKRGPGDGVEKGREKIADAYPGHVHQVDAYAQDHQSAGRGNGVQDSRFAQELEMRREQGNAALDQKDG